MKSHVLVVVLLSTIICGWAFESLVYPYTTAAPSFVTTTKKHPVTPRNYGTFSRPYKTNQWFTVLGISDGTAQFGPLPYLVSATFGGLQVCTPTVVTTIGAVGSGCANSIQVSAKDHLARHTITAFDDLTTTIVYNVITQPECPGFTYFEGGYDLSGRDLFQVSADPEDCCAPCAKNSSCGGFTWYNGECYMKSQITGSVRSFGRVSSTKNAEIKPPVKQPKANANVLFPIAHGSPYISAIYTDVTPFLMTAAVIRSVNGKQAPTTVTDSTFEIVLSDGSNWIVFTSAPITLTSSQNNIEASSPFSGWLRVASVPSSAAQAGLIKYKDAIPISGKIDYGITGANSAQITFTWQLYSGGSGQLLMMSLKHHRDILENPTLVSDVVFSSTKGDMIGVVGSTWTLNENTLATITWESPHGILDCNHKDIIFQELADLEYYDPGPFEGVNASVYWYDKGIWKVARLALIADEFGATDIATTMRQILRSRLEPMLNGAVQNPWVYEPTWGGIVTNGSLDSFWNDYGAGWYDDHHFHLGYFLYCVAVITKGDLAWGQKFKPKIIDLLRDIVNPAADAYFPTVRHMDFYSGHSWAGGVFSGPRNQESTSEAVNAYYGTFLYGLSIGDNHIRDVGRVLLATEIRGAQTYWHMSSASNTYQEPFKDHKVVGILWEDGANYGTFFSAAPQCIHEIQMLPYSPITEQLLPQSWIEEQFPVLEKTRTPGWEDLVTANQAIIQPTQAWTNIFNVSFGAGTTLPDSLYWIATRPSNGPGNKCTKTYPPTPCPGSCCPVLVEVDSAGLQAGSYARFKRDYRIMFPNPGRGFNLAVLAASTHEVTSTAIFDTYGDSSASQAMLDFVQKVGNGQTVLVAVMDSTANTPAPQVVQAISLLGGKEGSQIIFRSSYALIGVKGGNALAEKYSAPTQGPVSLTHQYTC